MRGFRTAILVFAALVVSSSGFADEIQGVVDSVDPSTSTVVITEPASGGRRSVKVHPNVLAGVQTGSVVKASLKKGGKEAETLEVVVAK